MEARHGNALASYTMKLTKAAWTCLIATAIFAGIGFRFYHLATHGFWGDEGVTALRTAGHTQAEVIAAASGPAPIAAATMTAFATRPDGNWRSVVASLAAEDAQHAPGFYLLGYAWERVAGTAPVVLRLLSALLSLLLLPSAYWFAWEVFRSRTAAWTAVALAAISPFNVEYAQQAREYALWAATICGSSAALLFAIRRASVASWAWYALALAASLYTDVLSLVLLVPAHVAYVVAVHRADARTALRFAGAVGLALVSYVPWMAVLAYQIAHFHPVAWGYHHQTLKGAAYAWLVAFASAFVDLEYLGVRAFVLVLLVLAGEAAAVAAVARWSHRKEAWLLLCVGASPVLLQAGNAGFTDMTRYLTPTLLCIQIAVAWGLARGLERAASSVRPLAGAALAALVLLCAYDDDVRANTAVWWTNTYGAPLAPIAQVIDEYSADPALVVGRAPRDWEVLYDESFFLKAGDLVSYDASLLKRPPQGVRNVFELSRFGSFESRAGETARPIAVSLPRRGYALLDRSKDAASRPLIVVWLWKVEP